MCKMLCYCTLFSTFFVNEVAIFFNFTFNSIKNRRERKWYYEYDIKSFQFQYQSIFHNTPQKNHTFFVKNLQGFVPICTVLKKDIR